jgi:hypothetical protein
MIASALASAVAPSVSMVSSAARLGVHSFDVARLAYAQRRVDEDLDESIRADHVAHAVARGAIRTDRGAHGGAAMAHDFGGDESDAQDVRVAILFGEAETFGQMRAHHVAVEKRHLPAALVVDFPAPLSPVNQTQNPWRCLGGWLSVRISATSRRVNHCGNGRPAPR